MPVPTVSGTDNRAPGPTYELSFSAFGIPVRVSPWFWVVGALLGYSALQAGVQFLVAWLVVLFVSIMVHELGHAAVARAFGYSPGILLYQFGGVASYRPGPSHGPWRSVAISLAGPAAGFLLLGAVLLAREVLDPAILRPGDTSRFAGLPGFVVASLIWVNLWWGLLNLLPVSPLDGGQVCRELCAMARPAAWRGCAHGIGAAVGGAAAFMLFTRGYVYAAALFTLLAVSNVSALRRPGPGSAPGDRH